MIKIINKRGTTRNIEDTQFNEYERKGYVRVTGPQSKTNNNTNSNNSKTEKENK